MTDNDSPNKPVTHGMYTVMDETAICGAEIESPLNVTVFVFLLTCKDCVDALREHIKDIV